MSQQSNKPLPKSTSEVIDEALAAGQYTENEATQLKSVWQQAKMLTNLTPENREDFIRKELSRLFGPARAKEVITLLKARTEEVNRLSKLAAEQSMGITNPSKFQPQPVTGTLMQHMPHPQKQNFVAASSQQPQQVYMQTSHPQGAPIYGQGQPMTNPNMQRPIQSAHPSGYPHQQQQLQLQLQQQQLPMMNPQTQGAAPMMTQMQQFQGSGQPMVMQQFQGGHTQVGFNPNQNFNQNPNIPMQRQQQMSYLQQQQQQQQHQQQFQQQQQHFQSQQQLQQQQQPPVGQQLTNSQQLRQLQQQQEAARRAKLAKPAVDNRAAKAAKSVKTERQSSQLPAGASQGHLPAVPVGSAELASQMFSVSGEVIAGAGPGDTDVGSAHALEQMQAQARAQALAQAEAERAELALDQLPKGPSELRDEIAQVVSTTIEEAEEQNLAQDMRAALNARADRASSAISSSPVPLKERWKRENIVGEDRVFAIMSAVLGPESTIASLSAAASHPKKEPSQIPAFSVQDADGSGEAQSAGEGEGDQAADANEEGDGDDADDGDEKGAKGSLTLTADAREALSQGLQLHVVGLLDEALRQSRRRRNRSALSSYTSLIQMVVPSKNSTHPERYPLPEASSGMAMLFGPNMHFEIRQHEMAATAELRRITKEFEDGLVADISADDADRQRDGGAGKRKLDADGASSSTSGKRWWDREKSMLQAGLLSYEDMVLHHMKMKVARAKQIGPFVPKKSAGANTADSTTKTEGEESVAELIAKEGEIRLSQQKQRLQADQMCPFLDANEPDAIDRRDICAVLEQHIGSRQGSGTFSRKVGRSLKLAKFGMFPSVAAATTTTAGNVTLPPAPGLIRRHLPPSFQRTSIAAGFRVWPANPNPANPGSSTKQPAAPPAPARDSVLGNAVAVSQRNT